MRDFRIRRSRTRLYQLLGILLLCISIVAIFAQTTIAWFKDDSTTSNGDAEVTVIGTLDLDVTTNFNFYNLTLAPDRIYTEDNNDQRIGTYLKTSDQHDIKGAYVRIKFQTARRNVGEIEFISNFDLLDLYFNGNITTSASYTAADKNKWFYNTADGYYYYIGAVENTEVCFNAGYKTSNTMTNVESRAEVKISYTVETIQRQYGAYLEEWKTAPAVFIGWAEADEEVRWGQQPSKS